VTSAQSKLTLHEAFYGEYSASESRLKQLQEIVKELASLNASNIGAVQERSNKIGTDWTALAALADNKKRDLSEKLAIQQRYEQLRLNFAKLVKEYSVWVASQIESLNDYAFGATLETVQAFGAQLPKEDEELTAQSLQKKQAVDAAWAELQQNSIRDLKYTVLTDQDVAQRHKNLQDAMVARRDAHAAELARQAAMEEKRKEWAQRAQQFVDAVAARSASLNALSGEPDELIAAVQSAFADGASERAQLAELQTLAGELVAMGIGENRHTTHTVRSLQQRVQQLQSAVNNRIQSLREEQQLKSEYVARATELSAWIAQTLPTLQTVEFDNTLAGAQRVSAEFGHYKAGKRSETEAAKPELERLYRQIAALLQKNARPSWTPPSALGVEELNKQWAALEEEERRKEAAVRQEVARQEKLAALVRRFNSDADDLRQWLAQTETQVAAREAIDSLRAAQYALRLFDVHYVAELQLHEERAQQLQQLRAEIASLQYHDSAKIDAVGDEISGAFVQLKQHGDARRQYLEQALAVERQKDELRQSAATASKEFEQYVKLSTEQQMDADFGTTLAAVQSFEQQLTASDTELRAGAEQRRTAAQQAWEALKAASIADNSYTTLTIEDLATLNASLEEAIAKRRTAYAAELQRQQTMDAVRREWADGAKKFVDLLAEQKAALEAVNEQVRRQGKDKKKKKKKKKHQPPHHHTLCRMPKRKSLASPNSTNHIKVHANHRWLRSVSCTSV
jgi:hypothetical protein